MDHVTQATGSSLSAPRRYVIGNVYGNCTHGDPRVRKSEMGELCNYRYVQATSGPGQGNPLCILQDELQREQLALIRLTSEWMKMQIEISKRILQPPQQQEPPAGMYT